MAVEDTALPESRLPRRGLTFLYVVGFLIGWHLVDWLQEDRRGTDHTARQAPAAADSDLPDEPRKPGVYQCHSKACGYHWLRHPGGTGHHSWEGPFLANGDMLTGPTRHTWREVDDLWFDCTARLQWVHASVAGYLAETKHSSDR
jgi:hypothetical protein